ncbi:MAG: tetratricopeptide (TPR) repeat protein [Saprospiraceae bacterium]|jgi:tetratricopeptide (TPR) repeat protein
MRLKILLLLITLCSSQLMAQNRSIDSLINLLSATSDKAEKIALKCKISQGYTEIGEYGKGGELANEALVEATEAKDEKGTGLAYYSLARLNQYRRDWDKALIYHYQAIQLFDAVDSHEDLAWTYLNMGIAFHAQKDYKRSIRYVGKALEIFKKIKHDQGVAYSLLNLGLPLHEYGSTDSAITRLLDAKKICMKIGDMRGVGYVHNIMGEIFLKTEKLDKALIEYSDNIIIRTKENDKRDLSFCYGSAGRIYFKQGLPKKAEIALETGAQFGIEIKANLSLKNIYLTWSQLDSLNGNHQAAYVHFKRYNHFESLLSTEEQERKIVALQYNFDAKQKEQEEKFLETQKEMEMKNLAVSSDSKNIQFALLATGSVIILLLVILLFKKAKQN